MTTKDVINGLCKQYGYKGGDPVSTAAFSLKMDVIEQFLTSINEKGCGNPTFNGVNLRLPFIKLISIYNAATDAYTPVSYLMFIKEAVKLAEKILVLHFKEPKSV